MSATAEAARVVAQAERARVATREQVRIQEVRRLAQKPLEARLAQVRQKAEANAKTLTPAEQRLQAINEFRDLPAVDVDAGQRYQQNGSTEQGISLSGGKPIVLQEVPDGDRVVKNAKVTKILAGTADTFYCEVEGVADAVAIPRETFTELQLRAEAGSLGDGWGEDGPLMQAYLKSLSQGESAMKGAGVDDIVRKTAERQGVAGEGAVKGLRAQVEQNLASVKGDAAKEAPYQAALDTLSDRLILDGDILVRVVQDLGGKDGIQSLRAGILAQKDQLDAALQAAPNDQGLKDRIAALNTQVAGLDIAAQAADDPTALRQDAMEAAQKLTSNTTLRKAFEEGDLDAIRQALGVDHQPSDTAPQKVEKTRKQKMLDAAKFVGIGSAAGLVLLMLTMKGSVQGM